MENILQTADRLFQNRYIISIKYRIFFRKSTAYNPHILAKPQRPGINVNMENILQTADRLFQNRYIISIKKAFTITLPVIILGSIASLVNNIPINIMAQSAQRDPTIRGYNANAQIGGYTCEG